MSLLIQLLNQFQGAEFLTTTVVTTTNIYKPTDAKEKQTIMDGDIPKPLGIFIHLIQNQEDLDTACYQWVKDPEGPYIIFNIIEYSK
jgi:hypothetical protein